MIETKAGLIPAFLIEQALHVLRQASVDENR
jgi:hypothetical protein